MATNYTITITLTDNSDPNGPNNFNYAPGFLQVHRGDNVRFVCNRPFSIKFLYGTPFASTSGSSSNSPSTPTAYSTIDSKAALQAYHYTVSATDSDGIIHMDGGCPTIEVG
jgi:hypothetical protein